MATKKKNIQKLRFEEKLVLNQFFLKTFGADSFSMFSKELNKPSLENIDEEGSTTFLKEILNTFGDKIQISRDKLNEYDSNIVLHLQKINKNRRVKINLKYYQYICLLFVEYYLDLYFGDRDTLIEKLDTHIEEFNELHPNDTINRYSLDDLNKLCVWSATGSGKTLLMHINYLQYLHYSNNRIVNNSNFILITPKENLSLQHLDEFKESGIPSAIYDKNASKANSKKYQINILENTKLDRKDGDSKVNVDRFGDENVVFTDEGHKGMSGNMWLEMRNSLCNKGFSFEYSATFGQAIDSSKEFKGLEEKYLKNIIFDYSYKYFHKDGYGKDYNILNFINDEDSLTQLYLTGCLLMFYQQKKLYINNINAFEQFNVDNPLLVFVGASVNCVSKVNGEETSDILNILSFINNFINEPTVYMQYIARIISGNSGVLDSNNRDIFRKSFQYISSEELNVKDIYYDILKLIFNCNSSNATLHVENIKDVKGEIQLRLGENMPFGLIDVGDDDKLIKLLSTKKYNTDNINFSMSLFKNISNKNSSINILIGSRKFTEGWNSYRVSSMGLMNVGKKNGSEIIQLFGRGVRLKGIELSLKRSSEYAKHNSEVILPKYLHLLETLFVFGIKADYMSKFNEYLRKDGIGINRGQSTTITLPIIKNRAYQKDELQSLKLKKGIDFKKDAPKVIFRYEKNISPPIEIDCYGKAQYESSISVNIVSSKKNTVTIPTEYINLLNYDTIYFELQRYKQLKNYHNVIVTKNNIVEILKYHDWYTIYIPKEEMIINSFNDIKRIENIITSLLKKYMDRQYYMEKSKWESPLLSYSPLKDNDDNFLETKEYTVTISNIDTNIDSLNFIEGLEKELSIAVNSETIPDFVHVKDEVSSISFLENLYNPLFHLENNNKGLSDIEISISPVTLNDSEIKFVCDLRSFVKENKNKFEGSKIYIIRNRVKKGIGFFQESGFYPDFIMWFLIGDKQYITFIDPHGMRNSSIQDHKVQLSHKIKDIQENMGNDNIILNSIILTPTKRRNLIQNDISEEEWRYNNVLFMDNPNYIENIFEIITK